MKCLNFLLSFGFLCKFGSPFMVRSKAIMQPATTFPSWSGKVLFSSPDDESSNTTIETTSTANSSAQRSMDPDGTSFPIDMPSPILLSMSMILAIIGTGSAFDLAGGSPNLGFGPTAAVAVVVIPVCLFLFYASILKATAETEADDKEFLKGK